MINSSANCSLACEDDSVLIAKMLGHNLNNILLINYSLNVMRSDKRDFKSGYSFWEKQFKWVWDIFWVFLLSIDYGQSVLGHGEKRV